MDAAKAKAKADKAKKDRRIPLAGARKGTTFGDRNVSNSEGGEFWVRTCFTPVEASTVVVVPRSIVYAD